MGGDLASEWLTAKRAGVCRTGLADSRRLGANCPPQPIAQSKRERGCVQRISRSAAGCWETGKSCSPSIPPDLLRQVFRTQSRAKNLHSA